MAGIDDKVIGNRVGREPDVSTELRSIGDSLCSASPPAELSNQAACTTAVQTFVNNHPTNTIAELRKITDGVSKHCAKDLLKVGTVATGTNACVAEDFSKSSTPREGIDWKKPDGTIIETRKLVLPGGVKTIDEAMPKPKEPEKDSKALAKAAAKAIIDAGANLDDALLQKEYPNYLKAPPGALTEEDVTKVTQAITTALAATPRKVTIPVLNQITADTTSAAAGETYQKAPRDALATARPEQKAKLKELETTLAGTTPVKDVVLLPLLVPIYYTTALQVGGASKEKPDTPTADILDEITVDDRISKLFVTAHTKTPQVYDVTGAKSADGQAGLSALLTAAKAEAHKNASKILNPKPGFSFKLNIVPALFPTPTLQGEGKLRTTLWEQGSINVYGESSFTLASTTPNFGKADKDAATIFVYNRGDAGVNHPSWIGAIGVSAEFENLENHLALGSFEADGAFPIGGLELGITPRFLKNAATGEYQLQFPTNCRIGAAKDGIIYADAYQEDDEEGHKKGDLRPNFLLPHGGLGFNIDTTPTLLLTNLGESEKWKFGLNIPFNYVDNGGDIDAAKILSLGGALTLGYGFATLTAGYTQKWIGTNGAPNDTLGDIKVSQLPVTLAFEIAKDPTTPKKNVHTISAKYVWTDGFGGGKQNEVAITSAPGDRAATAPAPTDALPSGYALTAVAHSIAVAYAYKWDHLSLGAKIGAQHFHQKEAILGMTSDSVLTSDNSWGPIAEGTVGITF